MALVRQHLGSRIFLELCPGHKIPGRISEAEANETVKFALAQAYRQRGDLDQAVSVLQSLPQKQSRSWITSSRWGRSFWTWISRIWLKVLPQGRHGNADGSQIALFRYLLGLSYYRLDDRKRLADSKRSTSTIRTFRIRLPSLQSWKGSEDVHVRALR